VIFLYFLNGGFKMTGAVSKNLSSSPIAIIGAGTLGRRIALMMCAHGAHVRLYDIRSESLNSAMRFIEAQLPLLVLKTSCTIGQIEFSKTMVEAVKDTWLVIEAIPENIDLKRSLFSELDRISPRNAILASNSSSYPSSKFVDNISTERCLRFVNTHFYMPPVQNAVEIGSCGFTDKIVINHLMDQMRAHGFYPFAIRKESIGFIFNRVWAAVKRECLQVVATGVSTPDDIDAIYKLCLGAHAGPFEIMDKVGLDVVYNIEENYVDNDLTLSDLPLTLLHFYLKEGFLGAKSGCGFYLYDEGGDIISINPHYTKLDIHL